MGQAKHHSRYEITDLVKIFEAFSSSVAMFDEDLDGDLDCLSAVRTDMDNETQTASFLWMLKGQNGYVNKNFTVHWKPGATLDEPLFRIDNSNGPWETADFLYTDYKDCIVMDFPYNGIKQCLLWITEEHKADVPQNCIDRFKEICDLKKIVFDEGSCSAL